MLDCTQVLYGSNPGNGNNHDNHNLPVLLAGGGFKHGQHLAFDKANNYPLPNLYVSMLQRLGIEAGAFSTSKGTMRGLAGESAVLTRPDGEARGAATSPESTPAHRPPAAESGGSPGRRASATSRWLRSSRWCCAG